MLELVVARTLYDRFPEFTEGRMAKVRSHVVSRASCAVVSRELELGERLRGEGSDDADKLSRNRNVLAALLEAALAALYLEHGFEAIEPAIVEAFEPRIEYALTTFVDHKTELQERLARTGRSVTYATVKVEGPPHDRSFTAAAVIGGEVVGTGRGRSKKDAEQDGGPGRRSRGSAEQAAVQLLRRGRRVDAEVVAQLRSQRLIDEQRLGGIALAVERLHQDPVTRFAYGSSATSCRPARTAADSSVPPTPSVEPAYASRARTCNSPSRRRFLVDPGSVPAGQERTPRHEHRDLRRAPRRVRVAEYEGALGTVHGSRCRLDVHPQIVDAGAQPVEGQHTAELGEERRQATVAARRPERLDQLVASRCVRSRCVTTKASSNRP